MVESWSAHLLQPLPHQTTSCTVFTRPPNLYWNIESIICLLFFGNPIKVSVRMRTHQSVVMRWLVEMGGCQGLNSFLRFRRFLPAFPLFTCINRIHSLWRWFFFKQRTSPFSCWLKFSSGLIKKLVWKLMLFDNLDYNFSLLQHMFKKAKELSDEKVFLLHHNF